MNIYLNDIGIVNALGSTKSQILDNLVGGRYPGMAPYGPLLSGRSTWVGSVTQTLDPLPEQFADLDCRNNQLLAAALDQISPSLAEVRERVGPDRVAVIIGTSTSGIAEGEDALEGLTGSGSWPVAFNYRQQEIGTAALFAARYLDITGPRYTISTACTSSAKAFASARRLIMSGRSDAAVVGGSDSLCRLTLNGFDALDALSSDICNPFSVNRDGITIGEGACVFVVSQLKGPVELLGSGESSDGYHVSAPDPQGRGAERAVRLALASAGLKPGEIGYINLHGTATRQNDAMETRVIERVFGLDTPCTSTKPQTGHTLGAAGAHEVGLCWLLLDESRNGRRLPPQIWDGVRDPRLADLRLVERGDSWKHAAFMSNSFAFGGSNASVIIGNRA